MNASRVSQRRATKVSWGAVVCIAYYVIVTLLLINNALFLEEELSWIAMAIPISQCSLVAVWAVTAKRSIALRFAGTILNTILCWYTLSNLLFWGIGDSASAAWAIALLTQVLMIVGVLHISSVTRRATSSEVTEKRFQPQAYVSFDLRTLMLWTTTFAIGFSFVQFGRIRWGWTGNIANWPHVEAMPLIGLFNAALGIAWLWASQSRNWKSRGLRWPITAVAAAGLSLALPRLIATVTGSYSLTTTASTLIAVVQSIHLLIGFSLATNPRSSSTNGSPQRLVNSKVSLSTEPSPTPHATSFSHLASQPTEVTAPSQTDLESDPPVPQKTDATRFQT
ncbi:MAG: hypothetical protein ACR2NZ_00530 [Rubripirellula sp.]